MKNTQTDVKPQIVSTRNIVSFHDLSTEWQAEAISNLDAEYALDVRYLEPEPDQLSSKHILWDLSECMPSKGMYNNFEYNAIIGISNNSAMLLNIDDACEVADITFV